MKNINLDSNSILQEIGIKNYKKDIKDSINKLTPIIDEPLEKKEQVKQWAKNKGATKLFIALADVYWELCKECGGVNPIVAYVQAAIETNFGKFDASLKEEFKNPCGIKVYNELEEDTIQEVYAKFITWLDGICAHLDHLALYAGVAEYPRENTVDPRHFSYLHGVCRSVEELSGKWSSSQKYGQDIVNFMKEISDTVVSEEFFAAVRPTYNITESVVAEKTKENVEQVTKILDELKVQNENICKVVEELKNCISELAEENKKLAQENLELVYELEKYKKVTNQINKNVSILNN